MWICFTAIALAILSAGCHYFNEKMGLPDDNIIEERVEQEIEDLTGLEVDLTPETEE